MSTFNYYNIIMTKKTLKVGKYKIQKRMCHISFFLVIVHTLEIY